MLYLATSGEQPLRRSSELHVEEIEPSRAAVRRWFSLPTIRFIGAHTGCSCGFPSVMADEPIPYFAGMFPDDEERAANLRSVDALLALIREHVMASGEAQLYPIAAGQESAAPKGTIELRLDTLRPETFFFNEQFLHRVVR